MKQARKLASSLIGIKDDVNLYTYVGNDPLDKVDPTGMDLEVVGSDDFKKKVNTDIDKLKATPSGKAAVEGLEKSPLSNKIVADDKKQGNATIPDSKADASNGKGTGVTIRFDPDKTTGGKDSKGSNTRPAEVGLAHEMGHAGAMNQGTQSFDRGSGKPGTTPPSEEPSMKTENAVRKDLGLPDRPSYYEQ